MENNRCAQCREPIEATERRVRLVHAEMDFHAACWAALHVTMQRDYELRSQDGGIVALLVPYHRTQVGAWLPSHGQDGVEGTDGADGAQIAPLTVAS